MTRNFHSMATVFTRRQPFSAILESELPPAGAGRKGRKRRESMKAETELSRRHFLRAAAGLGIAAAGLAPRPVRAAEKPVSANEKLVLGLIGCGGMGAVNMRTLMGKPGVEVAALCDVDESRIPRDAADVERKYGRKPAMQTRR